MFDKSALKLSIEVALEKSLSEYMVKEDLSKLMIAEFAGLSRDCMYIMLQRKRSPNVTTLCMLARVLRCTLDDLIPVEAYR